MAYTKTHTTKIFKTEHKIDFDMGTDILNIQYQLNMMPLKCKLIDFYSEEKADFKGQRCVMKFEEIREELE